MQASVNYVNPAGGNVVPFLLDAAWTGAGPVPTSVELIDGMAHPPTLEREGFTRARLVSGVDDYADTSQIEQRWIPAAAELVREVTGAKWVVCWAPNVRFSRRVAASRATPIAAPAPIVHSDQMPDFDVADLASQPHGGAAGAEVARRLGPGNRPRRWRIFNVWQQISPPPADFPLALCDLRSVAPDGIVEGRGKLQPGDEQVFPLTFFRPDPKHRWYHFPNLLPGEALIFSGLDPECAGTFGRVPHTAFEQPASANAIPRNSIEVRTLAVFED